MREMNGGQAETSTSDAFTRWRNVALNVMTAQTAVSEDETCTGATAVRGDGRGSSSLATYWYGCDRREQLGNKELVSYCWVEPLLAQTKGGV